MKKKKSPHPSDPVSTRNIFFSFKVLEHAPKVKDIKDVGIFFLYKRVPLSEMDTSTKALRYWAFQRS